MMAEEVASLPMSGRADENPHGCLRKAASRWASRQIERAATSIVLNIAESSSGGSNAEQDRSLDLALRSYLETITCLDAIELRSYLSTEDISPLREQGHGLFVRLSAFRRELR